MKMTQEIKNRWLALLRGGSYRPQPDPLPAGSRTAFVHLLVTSSPRTDAGDAPVPALLPRDWPGQVDALCDLLAASPHAAELAKRLVDSWVLAAASRVDADVSSTTDAEAHADPSLAADADGTASRGEAFDAVLKSDADVPGDA